MKRILGPLLYGTMLLYPVLIFFGLEEGRIKCLALILLSAAVLRLWIVRQEANPTLVSTAVPLALLLVAVSSLLQSSATAILYYPVIINAALAFSFGESLLRGKPIIETIARRSRPNLPPDAIIYTRNVTILWLVFFLINAAIALWTTRSGDLELWTLYNGGISYALIGIIFVIERFARRRISGRAA